MLRHQLPEPLDQLDDRYLSPRELKAGDTVFFEGDKAQGVYFVQQGAVNLSRVSASGHRVLIFRARAGDTFAEASLFSETYHCSAEAVAQTTVIECQKSAVLKQMEACLLFNQGLAKRLAQQVIWNRRQVELLSIRAADERVLVAIQDGLLVADIQSFSQQIGLAPETVYRSLKKLSDTGDIVKTARGKYQTASTSK